MKRECKSCEKLKEELARTKGLYERQIEWFKEEKKSKEDLRNKIDELMKEHKRILDLYFR